MKISSMRICMLGGNMGHKSLSLSLSLYISGARTSAKWQCACNKLWYLCHIHGLVGHAAGAANAKLPRQPNSDEPSSSSHRGHQPSAPELVMPVEPFLCFDDIFYFTYARPPFNLKVVRCDCAFVSYHSWYDDVVGVGTIRTVCQVESFV